MSDEWKTRLILIGFNGALVVAFLGLMWFMIRYGVTYGY